MLAALWGHADVVQLMIDKGEYLDARNVQGQTAFELAAAKGHTEIMKMLIEAGADKRSKALLEAAKNGHVDAVRFLLAAGVTELVNPKYSGTTTPLMLAAKGGHKAVAELLLDAGADVFYSDAANYTALYYAVDGGHADIVKMFLERDSGCFYGRGESFIEAAARKGNAEIMQMLLDRGWPASNHTDVVDALNQAQSRGYSDIVEMLRKYL